MATHPEGIVVNIVSIEESNRGHSCERHPVCGDHLNLDCIVRLRKVQIVTDDGREETGVTAFWVSDGINNCRVGYLPRHFIKNADKFDGKLAQITEFLAKSDSPSCRRLSHRNRGVCRAAIITGGWSNFCENYSPTAKVLNSALHSSSECLLAAHAADDIVGKVGKENDKKKTAKRSIITKNDAKRSAKLRREE
jgi:hypothetical protein